MWKKKLNIKRKKLKIMQFIDNNLKTVITTIITTASIVSGVIIYLSSNYYGNIINNLNSTIERLTPSIVENNKIDIAKLFIRKSGVLELTAPQNSIFIDSCMFYYIPDSYWHFQTMTPIQFFEYINDEKLKNSNIEIINNESYIWYSNFNIELNNPIYLDYIQQIESQTLVDSIGQNYIYKLNKKPRKLHQYIKLTILNNKLTYYKTRDLVNNYDVIDSTNFYDLGFRYYISDIIENIFNNLFENLPHSIAFTELNDILLNDNYLFISSYSVFSKKTIKDGGKTTIYSFNEWFVTKSDLHTYILEIQTPSYEPIRKGKQFIELNKWISGFKIITKS